MQTVNFHCPHCGNLMAVGTNLLGRNVRCPHCRQVVRAPAASGEAPAPPVPTPPPPRQPGVPSFNVPRPTEAHESIFGERHDEDVFGSEPPKPRMPDAPAPIAPSVPIAPTPQTIAETVAVQIPTPPVNPLAFDTAFSRSPALDVIAGDQPSPHLPDSAGEGAGDVSVRDDRAAYHPRQAREPAPGTAAFAWILLIYAGLATIAAGFFGYQYFTGDKNTGEHPFKAIPDFYGQYQKADRRQVAITGLPNSKLEVPPDLRVKLNEEITVGDLQVRPTGVKQQVMELTREHAVKENISSEAGRGLILTLRVKNVSTDTTFHPNDPAFNRASQDGQPLPYTALQIGSDYHYGPFAWPFDAQTKDAYVAGFKWPEEPLGPGEERDTWVMVAPSGAKASGSRDAVTRLESVPPTDTVLWRVQLRRGLVKTKDESGKDVEISATTVIGVEFHKDQIK
jgi:hypothetical protein